MNRNILTHSITGLMIILAYSAVSADDTGAGVITARRQINLDTAGKRGFDGPDHYLNPAMATSFETRDIPQNDSCRNAEVILGPYPVIGYGTTIDATIDCPSLLLWEGVWYKIRLQYEYNDLEITLCGSSADLNDAGILLMDDCDCDDLIGASNFEFLDESQCGSGHTGIELFFSSIPDNLNDESVIYWPVYAVDDSSNNMDFIYHINITEGEPPLPGDDCTNPIIVPSLPFSDSLNSCEYNNDYNFSGQDVVYQFNIDECTIADISLCGTEPIIDTYLLLYESDDCGGIPLVIDDDSCMPPGQYGTSAITDTLDPGLYYLIVDSYGGQCGNYVLQIDVEPCLVHGACCVESVCVGNMALSECDSLTGSWYENEDCDSGFSCPAGCFEYLAGDANMFNGAWPPSIIGSDVTYLVNYFRGSESNPACLLDGFWGAADANGDCNIIGSDVTRLVNYFRGIIDIVYCPYYQPCWQSADDLPGQMPQGWPNCSILR